MKKVLNDIQFKGAVAERTHTDGRAIYRAVATTAALDRYGEVVLPKGAMVENFLKNPVMLEIHDSKQSSIGHVVSLTIDETQMSFDFVFSQDQRGMEMEQKYKSQDMNAFSIGFRSKKAVDLWNPFNPEVPDIKELKVSYPDGSEGVVDLTRYEQMPYRVYSQWELLEISPVPVPANPEALLMREAEDIIRRAVETNPVLRSFVSEEVSEALYPALKLLEEFSTKFDDGYVLKGAVSRHSTPVEEGAWSGADARSALAKWASKGGSGKKEDMNWARYSKGFAWFDSKVADSFGAYKLPHHTVKDGALVAIWRGVTAAMSALLGARGGVDLSEKEAVYSHLAKHYKDFGKEAPVMKEYSDEELKAIEEAAEPVVEESKEIPSADSANPEGGENAAAEVPVEKAPGEGPDMRGKMDTVIAKLDEILKALTEDEETNQENFISLQLKVSAMQDILEYGSKKVAPAPEKKEEKKAEIMAVSQDLIADLERIAAIG